MIIIEGLDATGKSTLCEAIHKETNWPVQVSEGPEKHPGEIIDRCLRYMLLPHHTIFDRHPIISQSIYGPLSGKSTIPPGILQELKRRDPLIIEASSSNKFEHTIKAHDTPEHLDLIIKKREQIKLSYKEFLGEHFPRRLIYRLQFLETITQAAIAYAKRSEEKCQTQT